MLHASCHYCSLIHSAQNQDQDRPGAGRATLCSMRVLQSSRAGSKLDGRTLWRSLTTVPSRDGACGVSAPLPHYNTRLMGA